MLDVNLIRENPEKVKEGVGNKNVDPKLVDKFLRLDDKWRGKTELLGRLQAEQNKISKEISREKSDYLVSQAQVLKKKIAKVGDEEKKLKEDRDKVLGEIPNLPFDDVPVGKDESGNVVLREVGKKPNFKFKPKNYLELAEELGLVDVKRAARVSGARFGYITGDAALMEFALVKMAFDELLKRGFIPVVPPVMVRPGVMRKMGKGKFLDEKDAFHLKEDDLYLVGSAEHSIGPLHMNEVLDEEDLPRRYVGFSTSFRREAGSYGKDTRGILRVHQFDKVEMFSFAKPEESEKEHEFLLSLQEKLMKELELPYQVINKCTGDITWADARQYDIETWLPSEAVYRETHSASNTTDYQARGVNTKYRAKEGKGFVHMLNATAFAIGRTLIAIIENYQTEKGTIKIPKTLQKYIGKKEIG